MGAAAGLPSLALLAARCLLLAAALQTGRQQGGRRDGGLWADSSGDGGGGRSGGALDSAALGDARSTMRGALVPGSPMIEEHAAKRQPCCVASLAVHLVPLGRPSSSQLLSRAGDRPGLSP